MEASQPQIFKALDGPSIGHTAEISRDMYSWLAVWLTVWLNGWLAEWVNWWRVRGSVEGWMDDGCMHAWTAWMLEAWSAGIWMNYELTDGWIGGWMDWWLASYLAGWIQGGMNTAVVLTNTRPKLLPAASSVNHQRCCWCGASYKRVKKWQFNRFYIHQNPSDIVSVQLIYI